MGQFGARKLKMNRRKFQWRWNKKRRKMQHIWKEGPLEGAPLARAIVLKKKGIEQKQPHSGIIKAVRCQLAKNGIQITAFVPGTGAIKHIDEHDTVTVAGLGASQGGAIGSMWGVKHKVISVNNVDLKCIVSGKKEKPKGG